MSIFYIGLSLLSNRRAGPQSLHTEGRRILTLLEGGRSLSGRIAAEPGGRPYFIDRHGDFSISHSHRMAAAAYSTEKSRGAGKPLGTGCDIQYVHPAKTYEGIVRGFFSPEEQTYIAAGSPERERINRFYRIWVLKECFLKALGLSVFDMNRVPSFVACGDLKDTIDGPLISLRFYLYELGNSGSDRYLLAAAIEREREDFFVRQPSIRWFSEESLPVSK